MAALISKSKHDIQEPKHFSPAGKNTIELAFSGRDSNSIKNNIIPHISDATDAGDVPRKSRI